MQFAGGEPTCIKLRQFCVAIFTLVLCGTNCEISCQTGRTATVSPTELQTAPNLAKDPILVSIKGQPLLQANLIGANPTDSDAVLIELGGILSSIKIDEIVILQQPRKFDEYQPVNFNDEKMR